MTPRPPNLCSLLRIPSESENSYLNNTFLFHMRGCFFFHLLCVVCLSFCYLFVDYVPQSISCLSPPPLPHRHRRCCCSCLRMRVHVCGVLQVPHGVHLVSTSEHPVRVGVSDAYYIDTRLTRSKCDVTQRPPRLVIACNEAFRHSC